MSGQRKAAHAPARRPARRQLRARLPGSGHSKIFPVLRRPAIHRLPSQFLIFTRTATRRQSGPPRRATSAGPSACTSRLARPPSSASSLPTPSGPPPRHCYSTPGARPRRVPAVCWRSATASASTRTIRLRRSFNRSPRLAPYCASLHYEKSLF